MTDEAPRRGDADVIVASPKFAPSYLSWSQFDTFIQCGRKYELSYVERVPKGPKGYFIGGHAIHKTIEKSEELGWWALEEPWVRGGVGIARFVEVFNAELDRESQKGEVAWSGKKTKEFPDGENADWWRARGPMMLRRYASLRQEDDRKGLPSPLSEVKVTLSPEGVGKPLIGYVDALFPVGEGTELGVFGSEQVHVIEGFRGCLRDYKTGATYTPDHPLQLAVYGKAWHDLTGDLITRGQFIYLRAADGRLVYEVDLSDWYPVLDRLMEEWREAMDTGRYIHQPSWRCKSCDVAEHCEVGKLL